MNRKWLYLVAGTVLGTCITPAQAATLAAGDLLTIGSGSWHAIDSDGNRSIAEWEKVTIDPGTDGGLRIASTQTPGEIDSWSMFGNPGHHFTTVAPSGGTSTGIDFSGWSISYNGEPVIPGADYGAWTPVNCQDLGCDGIGFVSGVAAFDWSGQYGDSYSLWFSWSFQDSAPSAQILTDYVLHLQGVVLSADMAPVPLPPAAWLLGTGLLFMLRRRHCAAAGR